MNMNKMAGGGTDDKKRKCSNKNKTKKFKYMNENGKMIKKIMTRIYREETYE